MKPSLDVEGPTDSKLCFEAPTAGWFGMHPRFRHPLAIRKRRLGRLALGSAVGFRGPPASRILLSSPSSALFTSDATQSGSLRKLTRACELQRPPHTPRTFRRRAPSPGLRGSTSSKPRSKFRGAQLSRQPCASCFLLDAPSEALARQRLPIFRGIQGKLYVP